VSGQLELGGEALDGRAVPRDLWPDELEGDLLVELSVDDAEDPAHAAGAQLLDDLVAPGEEVARVELQRWRLGGVRGLRVAQGFLRRTGERGPAFPQKCWDSEFSRNS